MNKLQNLVEEITLVAEAGDPSDALELMRKYLRQGMKDLAIDVRRSVVRGELNRDELHAVAARLVERTATHQEWVRKEIRSITRSVRRSGIKNPITDALLQIGRAAA